MNEKTLLQRIFEWLFLASFTTAILKSIGLCSAIVNQESLMQHLVKIISYAMMSSIFWVIHTYLEESYNNFRPKWQIYQDALEATKAELAKEIKVSGDYEVNIRLARSENEKLQKALASLQNRLELSEKLANERAELYTTSCQELLAVRESLATEQNKIADLLANIAILEETVLSLSRKNEALKVTRSNLVELR